MNLDIINFYTLFRMRLCSSITEAEVDRAKKLLKTNLLLQLDGRFFNFSIFSIFNFFVYFQYNE